MAEYQHKHTDQSCRKSILRLDRVLRQLILVSSMLFTTFVGAQNNNVPESSNEAQELWSLLQQTSQQLDQQLKQQNPPDQLTDALSRICDTHQTDRLQEKVLTAKAKDMQQRRGLELRGGLTSESLSDDDEDSRSYVEFSWDLLHNGYRQNSKRAQALYREAEIAKLRTEKSAILSDHRCHRQALGDVFAGLQTYLLKLKLQLMEPVYQIEQRAYFKGWSYLDDLLVSDEDLQDTRSELAYLSRMDNITHSTLLNPPIIDVDIDEVITAIRNDDRDQQLISLQQKALQLKNEASSKNRLRLFVRQEFDISGRGDQSENDDLVAGLRFQIPLEKQRDSALPYQLQQSASEVEKDQWERIARTRAAYVELREQLRRLTRQQYRYLRAQERIRRSLVEKRLSDDAELATAVTRMRSLLNSGIELLRAKEELYRRVYDLFLAARIDYQSESISIVEPLDGRHRVRKGNRSIYLWSAAFNKIQNPQLIDFLQAKGISKILLSAGRKSNREKLREFTQQASERHVSTELIVGDNKWIFPERHQAAVSAIVSAVKLTGFVHLDIEPHTLPGYKKHRQQYLQHYLQLLRKLRPLLGDNRVSLALPLHWPEEIYRELAGIADQFYLMSYGSSDVEKLGRRIKRVTKLLPPDSSVVVLRMEDFPDEWALEKAFGWLQKNLGIEKFGIHKLSTLFGLPGQ